MHAWSAHLLLSALASASLMSCGGGSPTATRGTEVAIETVARSSYSGFATAQRRAIHSEQEWEAIWTEVNGNLRPTPPLPVFDFSRDTLLLAATGTRSSGCYSIDITGASMRGDGGVLLEVTETTPGSSCVCTQAQSRPVHVVKIARRTTAESFTDRRRERPC